VESLSFTDVDLVQLEESGSRTGQKKVALRIRRAERGGRQDICTSVVFAIFGSCICYISTGSCTCYIRVGSVSLSAIRDSRLSVSA